MRFIFFICYITISYPLLAGCTDPAQQNVDWQRCYFDGKILPKIDISGTNTKLRDSSFNRADLSQANLEHVDGFHTKFISTTLVETNFKNARLTEADFSRANLEKTNFEGANLRGARFFRANAKGANFKNAEMQGADLSHADFSNAIWADGRICKEGSIGQCN